MGRMGRGAILERALYTKRLETLVGFRIPELLGYITLTGSH